MNVIFLFGFLLMRSYSFVLSSVDTVKEKVASIFILVALMDQFVTAVVPQWEEYACLPPLPILLFYSQSHQAFISIIPAIQLSVKVTNKVHASKSSGQFSAVILLDSSVTFDRVDHCFLLEVLS